MKFKKGDRVVYLGNNDRMRGLAFIFDGTTPLVNVARLYTVEGHRIFYATIGELMLIETKRKKLNLPAWF